jgi:D-3-phosphoglycerate dehydrogenase
MPKVLISDELSPAAVAIFRTRGLEVDVRAGLKKDELLKIIGDYDGLAVRSATKVDKDVIAAAKKLKVIGRAGIGVDNIDIAAATARGIVVMNTPFGNSITTAEHAIALMFAAARQIAAADASTQAGKWEKNRFIGAELYAKTLGVIGCGNIGGIVAERGLGLKMKVIAYDPFLSPERAVQLGVEKVELEELLSRADVITLHVPLTDKTRNVLSREALVRTKKGVIIINAARGGLVDEQALREALESGHVAAAGFDVFTNEPAKENPLFGAPNFVATPHLGASTSEAQENVALQVAEQMSDYLLTGAVTNALNTPSISAEEAPRLKPFVALAERLGMFAGQITDDGLEAVEIEYEGEVAKLNTKPLTAAALAGLMRPLLPEVNMVSAPAVLREKGAALTESKRETSPTYESIIRIKVQTG